MQHEYECHRILSLPRESFRSISRDCSLTEKSGSILAKRMRRVVLSLSSEKRKHLVEVELARCFSPSPCSRLNFASATLALALCQDGQLSKIRPNHAKANLLPVLFAERNQVFNGENVDVFPFFRNDLTMADGDAVVVVADLYRFSTTTPDKGSRLLALARRHQQSRLASSRIDALSKSRSKKLSMRISRPRRFFSLSLSLCPSVFQKK